MVLCNPCTSVQVAGLAPLGPLCPIRAGHSSRTPPAVPNSENKVIRTCAVFFPVFLFGHCWCTAGVPDRQGGTQPKQLFPWMSFDGKVNVQLLNRIRYGLLSYTRKNPGCLASKIR